MTDPDPARRPRPANPLPATNRQNSDASATQDDAFALFYRATVKPLIAFLLMQGASTIDAAEIAQDTLVRTYTHWSTIHTNPKAWTYRTASHALIRRISTVHDEPTADLGSPNPLLRRTPTDAWHVRNELITALAALPGRQRQVMAWTLSGYKPAEIAEELGLPDEQVRANLRWARKTMSANLTDSEGDRP